MTDHFKMHRLHVARRYNL